MSDKVYRGAAIGRTGKGNWGHGLHLGLLHHPRVGIVAVADEDEQERNNRCSKSNNQRSYR